MSIPVNGVGMDSMITGDRPLRYKDANEEKEVVEHV